MGDDYDGEIEVERRKESKEVGKQLARIETILGALKEQFCSGLESLKTQLLVRFDSMENRQDTRDRECQKLEEEIINIRIEQGKQGVKITAGSVIASTIMAAIVAGIMAYFMRK